MDDAQENLSQESNKSEVMESIGVDPGKSDSLNESDQGNLAKEDDPLAIKKRLGMQAKKHQREMRSMQEQLAQMQAQLQHNYSVNSDLSNQYSSQPNNAGSNIEEQIQRGVRFALQAKEEEERKAKEAERMAHVHKQYQRMNNDFDKASEKYEDFDEVVRGDDAPFTPSVRDALLLIDNPADVAYKLGKNREELKRISSLHPLDQAREVNKLSFALMGGNGSSSVPSGQSVKPMGSIKANPVTSSVNNSAASIRAKMKAGTWK